MKIITIIKLLKLFFLEKMEQLAVQKINEVIKVKRNLIKIYGVGYKAHTVLECQRENCFCDQFLEELNNSISSISNENLSIQGQSKFFLICLNNKDIFLIIDQLIKQYTEIDFNNKELLQSAYLFESEKNKTKIKHYNKIKFIKTNLYLLEKTFK